jgi:hypothetical protein
MTKENRRKFILTERIVFAILAVAILGWLAWLDITPGGVLTMENDFRRKSPEMSDLRPEARLGGLSVDDAGNIFQGIYIDPVYFDAEIPRLFRTATVRLEYRNAGDYPFLQIGLQRKGGAWNWEFRPVENRDEAVANYRQEGDWRRAEAEFGLSPEIMDGRVLHFMISAPGLDKSEDEIRVRKITVTLERDPLTRDNLWPRLERLTGIKNQ